MHFWLNNGAIFESLIYFIMRSHLIFSFISVLSIVSALDSDLTWPSNGDFSLDTDLSSNQETLSSALPLDPDFGIDLTTPPADSYLTDIPSSDVPLDTNIDNSSILNFDSPLVVADCSSSERFPTIGKSRLRRLDGSTSCSNNPISGDTGGEVTLPTDLFSSDTAIDALEKKVTGDNQERNADCITYTQGALPVGLCSTGLLPDVSVIGSFPINGVQFISLTLRHATFRTFVL